MPAIAQHDPIARSRAKLYALANRLWQESPATKNEELHILVGGITGKDSIKELNAAEFAEVNKELEARLSARGIPARSTTTAKAKHPEKRGGVTSAQQSKIFRLMYLLIDCDEKPDKSSLGPRLCGIIKRQFGIDSGVRNPFAWMGAEEGHRLIEILKGYVESAETLAQQRGANKA